MFNKWRHNIDFPVFLSGLNIHCINVGSEFLSAVCQRGSSVTRHLHPASVLIIPSFLPVFALFLCDRAGVGCAVMAPTVGCARRLRVCEWYSGDCICAAFVTGPAKDKQATSVNTGPQDRCDSEENWKNTHTHMRPRAPKCSHCCPLGV